MLRLPSRFALRFAAYVAACVFAGTALWIRRAFGDVSLDQVLWHLLYADSEAFRVSTVFWVEYLVEALLVPTVVAFVATCADAFLSRRLTGWSLRLLRGAPIAGCVTAVAAVAIQFSVFSYAAAYWQPDRFSQSYVDPKQVKLVPSKPRNLIVVYVESLEATYGRPDLFGRDLLAPLRQPGGVSFSDYRPIAGMNWTMEGIVSTQCGIPLKIYIESDVRRRRGAKTFLPSATCLGDVLQGQGYHNVFMGGASLSFAGKGSFFRDHGYSEVWGRDEWKRESVPKEDLNIWGLNDAALLEKARARLAQLHAAGRPFVLTVLTVDTHHPSGLMSRECLAAGGQGFGGILGCTVNQVAGFVRFAREQGYLRDTTLVVLGDHLAVYNPLLKTLQAAGPDRRIFNLILGHEVPAVNRNEVVAFDFFPTMLELAGTHVSGSRLALGYSAVGTPEAVRPSDWVDSWSLNQLAGSARYDALWSGDPHAADNGD